MKQAARIRGFTLIEILVALAGMALIATILVSSLHVAGTTWQRVKRGDTNADSILRAQDFLRRALGTMAVQDPSTDVVAQLGPQTLEFSAAALQALPDPQRYRIELSSESHLEVSLLSGKEPTSREVLLADVASWSVEYFVQAPGAPGHWIDHPAPSAELPRLIRINVMFPPRDSRRWPTLYVEPRIDTSSRCVFDVVSRHCRAES